MDKKIYFYSKKPRPRGIKQTKNKQTMALTAPRIVASIYGIDNGFGLKDISRANNGRTNNFTNVGQLKFYPAPLGTTSNGVTMQSIIEQSPSGMMAKATKYYTDSTVASIISNGA